MSNEQRRRLRFAGGDEVFAAFIRPNEPIIVGKIIDISLGGLGVRYLSPENLTGSYDVTLFAALSPQTERIRARVVHNREVEESLDIQPVRHCGLKFDQMFNRIELQSFIHQHFATQGSI